MSPALLAITFSCLTSSLAFINPGVGLGLPTGFPLPQLGKTPG